MLTENSGDKYSHLSYITGVMTKFRFLKNFGEEVGILPENFNDRLDEAVFNLQAANGKPIATYGKRYAYRNMVLRKPNHWILVVADASMSIIDADLLKHYNLFTDTRKRGLLDDNNKSFVSVTSNSDFKLSPVTVQNTTDSCYQKILDMYTEIKQTQPKQPCATRNVTHHITTTLLPVFLKARQIAPEMLRLAKNVFDHMIDSGIVRLSKSSCASPLHMASKSDNSDWHQPGDSRFHRTLIDANGI